MKTIRTALGCLALAASLSAGGMALAEAFKWPRFLVIATPGTVSGAFASTNGWAPVLQKETGMIVRVVPEANEATRFRRLTERRDVALSSVSAAEMRVQIEGSGSYSDVKPAAPRILWHHNDTPWGYVVAGGSRLQSLKDLAEGGYRVANGVFSPSMTAAVTRSLPAYVGLTPEEAAQKITFVPASSYAENCRSVVEGKADVALCSPISSLLSEMEGAPGGIRWLPLEASDKEGIAGYLDGRPMLAPARIDMGVSSAREVEGMTSNFLYAVPADADAELAYQLAKWLHRSHDAYKGAHPLAGRMSIAKFREYLDLTPLPVHEGTVRYLREIGQWTEEDDRWNMAAREKADAWVAAREAALAEAGAKGIRIDDENPDFIAILNAKTAGLERFRSRL